jgi:ribosomal protein S18 acetylase RimI-like enzyme
MTDIRRLMNLVENADEEQHWKEFYTELPGAKADHAPYIVRKTQEDGRPVYGVYHEGRRIGMAKLSTDGDYVSDVAVAKEHRRRGIARALYRYIENDIGRKLKPSPLHQTADGKALWSKR